MGINPTPTNHRSFTFDGKSTREFGVYITGEGVFNAPERATEMISIPGRDGEYALDQGHFNNIEVTYRAGIVSDSTTDFAEAVSDFRNWLASRRGYCRLTDEYNPDEYRMAVFKNVISVEHEGLETGEFDVVFNCKPQRWLTSGETAITVTSGDDITNPTLFDSAPLLAVEGYGSVKFNNRSIVDIEDVPLGQIVVLDDSTPQHEGTSTLPTYQIDTSLLNNGDIITAEISMEGETTVDVRYSVRSSPPPVSDSNSDFNSSQHLTYTRTTATIQFPKGTDYTATNTATGTLKLTRVKPTPTLDFTVDYSYVQTINYDASTDQITVQITWSATSSSSSIHPSSTKDMRTVKKVYATADATTSGLGHPTYIDCDIGEAYMIKNDEIVSLNQQIDLGSDLPTLPPGTTEITFDNTVTELKITPRWWKV